jgi:hypothetical protein
MAIKESQFSYFKGGIFQTKPYKDVGIPQVYDLIRQGYSLKDKTLKIRELYEEFSATRDEILKRIIADEKKTLDYVTFAGTFEKRDMAFIREYSGLACFDVEYVEPEMFKAWLFDRWNRKQFAPFIDPVMAFTSPSAKGVKVVLRTSGEKYGTFYARIREYLWRRFSIITDATSDPSRACYMCYDENVKLINYTNGQ